MAEGCCGKCGSRLFPDDEKYVKATGVCSYCVTYDNTPDKRFQKAYEESKMMAMTKKPDWNKIYRKRKYNRS